MQDMDSNEKFDIKKLPRLEIDKPIDQMMRILVVIFCLVIPIGTLLRGLRDDMIEVPNALLIGAAWLVLVAAIYYGVKRFYVLDRMRKALFRATRIFGSVSESYVCAFSDISCVAIDSHERTTKNGGSTGQFWYESCFILKNKKIIRLHRTFEDSYDEIQDAEQYAEYLGCRFFGPKPGLEMKVVNDANGGTSVEFSR
ncbi:MAG: hypothetical protein KKB51_08675 [Candidatus Riflebacteria bacterium]|nr:hypothetical protein [Candidatus Riflebacteria bacterium]